MPRLELFPFRYRDPVNRKWVRARYVAERHEIAARYAEWEIIGPPEIRHVDPEARYFTPWKVLPHAELVRPEDRAPELQPHHERPPAVDGLEAFLVKVFLRRYVAYCAKRHRYSQMEGAVRLYREIAEAGSRVTSRTDV